LNEAVHTRDGLIAALESEVAAVNQATAHGQDEAAQLAEVLSARDNQLAARDRDLAELHQAYARRHDQAARFARRARRRSQRISELQTAAAGDSRNGDQELYRGSHVGYLVFAQFAQRYALVERVGVLPAPDEVFELPDAGPGALRVLRVGPSPLPNDARSCVFAERVHVSA
jgi:hypothetical protein